MCSPPSRSLRHDRFLLLDPHVRLLLSIRDVRFLSSCSLSLCADLPPGASGGFCSLFFFSTEDGRCVPFFLALCVLLIASPLIRSLLPSPSLSFALSARPAPIRHVCLSAERRCQGPCFSPLRLRPSFVAAFRSPSGFPPCPRLLLNIDNLWLHSLNSRLSRPSTSPCHAFSHATHIALCHLPLPSHFYPFRFASSRVSRGRFIFSLLHPSESLSFAHVSASS